MLILDYNALRNQWQNALTRIGLAANFAIVSASARRSFARSLTQASESRGDQSQLKKKR